MHGPMNVKSPNNTSKWQMGFNSAFKGLSIHEFACKTEENGEKHRYGQPVQWTRLVQGISDCEAVLLETTSFVFCLQHFLKCVITYGFVLSKGTDITGFNPLNPELNPICYLLALLGAHHFLHVSRIRVNESLFLLRSVVCSFQHKFDMIFSVKHIQLCFGTIN